MEVIAPSEQRYHSNHADWYQQYRHSGGLATPKSSTSHGSCESLLMDRPRGVPSDVPVLPQIVDRPSIATPAMSSADRQPSYHFNVLPPLAGPRPSLPPISALLAEPLASPPATPTASRLSLDGSPRTHHPEYTRTHKRGCSSLAWSQRPSETSPRRHGLGPLYHDMPVRRDSATQATLESSGYRHIKDVHSQQRSSVPYLPELRAPQYESRTTSPEHSSITATEESSRKRSFETSSGPGSYDRQAATAAWRDSARYIPAPRPAFRPASPGLYRSYPPSAVPMTRPEQHMTPQARPTLPPYHHAAPGAVSHAAAYDRPAIYDYQLAKARKRSNLPKESTDIMKIWFEEHLDNPYPSEDEKKFFATKAGINLTQVSNWFINHRRRCPELREQRDKKQATNQHGTPVQSP